MNRDTKRTLWALDAGIALEQASHAGVKYVTGAVAVKQATDVERIADALETIAKAYEPQTVVEAPKREVLGKVKDVDEIKDFEIESPKPHAAKLRMLVDVDGDLTCYITSADKRDEYGDKLSMFAYIQGENTDELRRFRTWVNEAVAALLNDA